MAPLPLLASLASRRPASVASASNEPSTAASEAWTHWSSGDSPKVKKKTKKKAKKGAPQEVSSRKPVAPNTGVNKRKVVARDPRFDDFSGKLDMDLFAKSYSFLEEYQQAEKEELQKKLKVMKKKRKKKTGSSAPMAEITNEIRQIDQMEKQRRRLDDVRTMELQVKREEREKVRTTGKTPYFHKRGAVRKLVIEKRQDTKKSHLRSKEAERREKKIAGKEKRRLPTRRISAEER
eukprot:TRINITY_DN26765_c0_g1_i1.p1 TRINITY_DN26765_c0_g1~~TRINITY_DN26765_c0_g1_i1.p1  ORF type:complete len:273 (+),score=62.38 TRINITY_DN26765_c0_g1_i1:117-821(+)